MNARPILFPAVLVSFVCAFLIGTTPALSDPIPFTLERPDTAGFVSIASSALQVDSSVRPRVVYRRTDGGRHAWREESGWSSEPAPGAGPLALGSDDQPRTLYITDPNLALCPECAPTAKLWVARHTNAGWSSELLAQTLWTTTSAIGFDPSGTLHAAFTRYDDPSGPDGLVFATLRDGGWNFESVAAAGPDPITLAFDSRGVPHLAWLDHLDAGGAFYAVREDNCWSVEPIEGFGSPSLAVGPDDRPLVAMTAPDGLHLLTRESGAWTREDVGVIAREAVLRIDRYGRPVIAYADAERRLSIAWKDQGEWRSQRIDSDAIAFSVSLALAGNAEPRISYEDFDRKDFCYAAGSLPAPPPVAWRASLDGDSRVIPIGTGGGSLCVRLQPAALDNTGSGVIESSIIMRSEGTGTVSEINAIALKSEGGGDRDHDGIAEIRAYFASSDLASLLGSVPARAEVHVLVEGDLISGSRFQAQLVLDVRRVGARSTARVYPDPLNPTGTLGVVVQRPGRIRLQIFTAAGTLVRTVYDGWSESGYREFPITSSTGETMLSSGIYFFRGETAGERFSGKFAVLK